MLIINEMHASVAEGRPLELWNISMIVDKVANYELHITIN